MKEYANKKNKKINLPSIGVSIFILYYIHLGFREYFFPIYFPNIYKSQKLFKYIQIKNDSFKEHNHELIIFIITFILLYYSLYKTLKSNSNFIPECYPWILDDTDKIDERLNEIENELKKNNNAIYSQGNKIEIHERDEKSHGIRYCTYCKKIKPDRAHHCQWCNKCFLKYDHHCSLIDKCININNYKYFLLTIFYGLVLSVLMFVLFGRNLYRIYLKEKVFKGYLYYYISLLILSWLDIFLLIMFLFHIYLISKNMTNVEFIRATKYRDILDPYWSYDKEVYKKSCYKRLISIYNLGFINNFKDVFGSNIFLWLLPISNKNMKNELYGISYKVNKKYIEPKEKVASI